MRRVRTVAANALIRSIRRQYWAVDSQLQRPVCRWLLVPRRVNGRYRGGVSSWAVLPSRRCLVHKLQRGTVRQLTRHDDGQLQRRVWRGSVLVSR